MFRAGRRPVLQKFARSPRKGVVSRNKCDNSLGESAAMLLEPQTTEWDLRWMMFGIPVRVHPFFWLVCLLMGQSALELGVLYLLAWIGCVFVSILVHELGHV